MRLTQHVRAVHYQWPSDITPSVWARLPIQKQSVSLRPGISFIFKGDLLGSLWFHYGFPAFKAFLPIWVAHSGKVFGAWWDVTAMPTYYPTEHLALASARGMGWCQSRPITWHHLLTFTWSSHHPQDKVVSQAAVKCGVCAAESGVQRKERHFPLIVQTREPWKEFGKR